MTEREKLLSAIEALGSTDEARGAAVGVTGRTVWNWRNDAKGMTTVHKLLDAGVITVAPIKHIKPIMDGNRTIGWRGYYGDFCAVATDGAGSKDECSQRLDAWVREELSK